LGDKTGKVTLMNPRLNAPQIKYVISKCRFFIGARTHSTIAALSSNIPTVSIAYSIKARGINQDIFGHTDYVLDVNNLNYHSLINYFDSLIKNEAIIKKQLPEKQQEWNYKAELLISTIKGS
jgi:polysaccharide pyruvyl transferase WcaK-like protein